ncbi:MAG: NCS2 family permease [Clostridia bacterium]|nr:NCS2 family permease [Clostridia bacterium]
MSNNTNEEFVKSTKDEPIQESDKQGVATPAKKGNWFTRLVGFDPEAKQTNVRTELIAGVVTFLAMAYILTVNPNQLFGSTASAYWASAFIATAIGAVIGTLLMAFFAKMPLAQASGMGLNAMLGGMIAGTSGYGAKFTPGQAFFLVLISGLVFMLLSVIKINGKTFRELVFDGMPVAVRSAISVGIGLFIAFIGFQNAGIIVTNGFTQIGFVDFTDWGSQLIQNGVLPDGKDGFAVAVPFTGEAAKTAAVAFIGLFLIAILDKLKVKGSVIFGILGATVVGIPLKVTNLNVLTGSEDGISWKFWENFSRFFTAGAPEYEQVIENGIPQFDPKTGEAIMQEVAGSGSVFGSFINVFTGEGLIPAGATIFTIIMIVITLCMIDMFDTMGTIVGCCGGNRVLSDENNKPHNYGKIMIADSVATCTGAMVGTSTVTTFVESGAGVSAGGRTGLTAFTTACLFFLAMFAMPVFAVIPSAATASALIYVGVLMMKNNVKNIDFSHAINATSAFLTIAVMVLSYSITTGIGVGMISYTVMTAIAYLIDIIKYAIQKKQGKSVEKPRWEVSVVAIIVALLFVAYFFVPATLF